MSSFVRVLVIVAVAFVATAQPVYNLDGTYSTPTSFNPGTYTSAGVVNFNAQITLNCLTPLSTFNFITNGALNVNANVVELNGPCVVNWNVGGVLNIAAGFALAGSATSNGAGNLAAGASLGGSLNANGAVTVAANGQVGGPINATGAVTIDTGSVVHGNVTSGGAITVTGATIYGCLTAAGAITVTDSKVYCVQGGGAVTVTGSSTAGTVTGAGAVVVTGSTNVTNVNGNTSVAVGTGVTVAGTVTGPCAPASANPNCTPCDYAFSSSLGDQYCSTCILTGSALTSSSTGTAKICMLPCGY